MDFIKTSSLRALIELTFQRNWNGLIWMSRKGVITKRVKTVQTALSRISAQPRSPAGRGTNVPRSAKVISVRLKSRPKFETDRPITITTRETCPRSAKLQPFHATPRTTMPREPGNKPRGRATHFAYHGRCIRPSRERTSHVRPRNHRPKSSPVRPRRPTEESSGHDRSDSPTIRLSGRSSRRPSQRRGRPEARFEARFHIFKARLNPKPPQKT
ncbi:unnamed protein product [Microthlaspi erraticum]|uniref:Uncharacterized protein n=1 Tax=Microthlaspi erraticum TaxID=1685480 RepID=A0A6D2JYN4_9BRAS|nr:unnamed protein product [Microthlaspi erraticum]